MSFVINAFIEAFSASSGAMGMSALLSLDDFLVETTTSSNSCSPDVICFADFLAATLSMFFCRGSYSSLDLSAIKASPKAK